MQTMKNNDENLLYLNKRFGTLLVAAGVYTRIFSRRSFQNSKLEITPEQFVVIEILMQHDGLYQRQLCELAIKDRPNMTRIINILEKSGYVERKSDKNKRKVYKIFLTQKAKEMFSKLSFTANNYRSTIIEGINEDELNVCKKVLSKVVDNLLDKVDISM